MTDELKKPQQPDGEARQQPDKPEPAAEAVPEVVPPQPQPQSPEARDGHPQIPAELPVLPIRESVAFPGTIMPLSIGRERSKRLVEQAVRGNKLIAVVAQRDREIEEPTPDQLYRIGTACTILKLLTMPDGGINIIVHGLTRVVVESVTSTEPFMVARVSPREDATEKTPELDALLHTVRQTAYRVFELSPNVPDEARIVLDNIDTPGGIADFLAANLSVGASNKQELLETLNVSERLRKVHSNLTNQLEMLEMSNKIQTQVRDQIGKTQREYYLQEQMKAIQKELGQTDGRTAELDRLREAIAAAKMPEAVQKEAERELGRLERIPQASPEYSVAVDYITWLCELPWSKSTTDQLNLNRAKKILDEDHYDLEKIKTRILEYLAVLKLKHDGRGPILCFVGPPGVGKTSLGKSIARSLGRKFVRLSLGGIHDEAQLRGHRRTYIGAMPGRILQEIRRVAVNNPVFMLDEVDKIGHDFRGDPSSALLEILDPQQNHTFNDNYVDVPFDLSKVMFIATGNYLEGIPEPLRDRMEMITLAGYTTREKVQIARKYLVPRQQKENGLKVRDLAISDDGLEKIAAEYTREAGVRDLERQIGKICRVVAARVARGRRVKVKIAARNLADFLGPRRFGHEVAQRTTVPGVATGLAFTPAGGEILFIEATAMRGAGRLTLTGQIGNVMKESAQAAFSLVRSRAKRLGINPDKLRRYDVHIHVPAGAVPKDGPSAGVAMTTALVSLFTGRPCRSDVAMTGEITLTGRVLPIGGVKEKILAAHRAGIKVAILPSENRKDMEDIPPDVRRKMRFVFAASIAQVLKTALESAPAPAEKKATEKKTLHKRRKPTSRTTTASAGH
jgi:ATP-dependent Lon protease